LEEENSNMKGTITGQETTTLNALLEKVYNYGGYDFRGYKHGTVMRRLEGRLYSTGTKTYLDYMEFLDDHPEEYQRLADVLTIKISGFFRSPYAFQQVTRMVVPELVSRKKRGGKTNLRFWSTACARGQEPYSIAILLAKSLRNELNDFNVSIYATDISQQALRDAQRGIYSAKEVEGLTPADRESYFIHRNNSYAVRADIKQMVSLSYFDLASPAKSPFTDIDCIFCCNVLIYLQTHLQESVLGMLYDSLTTPGYLVLGEVETLTSNLNEKLECLDNKARIYKKV
jgi:two-component system CheB/CheR fusion protein